MKIGYTQGTFDMFHIGHLNLLKNAKDRCDYLIVGVNSDELVNEYKKKVPIIPESERVTIVANIKCVDEAITTHTLDKTEIWNMVHFDEIYIGDDWKGNPRWEQTRKDLHELGAEVVFLPHTDGISSTDLRSKLGSKS